MLDPGAHLISMGVFGFVGYWAYQWDLRAAQLIAAKRTAIVERRRQEIAKTEEIGAAALADA